MKNNTLSALMELCKRDCLEGETSYMRVGQARQDCDVATERKLGSQRIKLAGKGEEENCVRCSFVQPHFIEHLQCARHCSRCWGYSGE